MASSPLLLFSWKMGLSPDHTSSVFTTAHPIRGHLTISAGTDVHDCRSYEQSMVFSFMLFCFDNHWSYRFPNYPTPLSERILELQGLVWEEDHLKEQGPFIFWKSMQKIGKLSRIMVCDGIFLGGSCAQARCSQLCLKFSIRL